MRAVNIHWTTGSLVDPNAYMATAVETILLLTKQEVQT